MNKRALFFLALLLLFVCIPDLAFAGAGGSIAKAITKSFWGKVLLLLATIILSPIILYLFLREKIAIRKTMKDLAQLAKVNPVFDYFHIKSRATDIFTRVQHSWDKNQIEDASEWMDNWYWQNQKIIHLEGWENKGLGNTVNVKKVKSIDPLFVQWSDAKDAENAIVVVSINALMQDYLYQKSTGVIVEGDKEYKEVETIWTLVLHQGKWVVQNIEESEMALSYAKMENVLTPKIAASYA